VKCKCGQHIPSKRLELGYSVCVECSSEPAWSCSALTYHKTGNTIEIIKDPELAYNINQMASRKSFGVMKGITGSWTRYRKPTEGHTKPQKVDLTGQIISEKRVSSYVPRLREDRFDAIGHRAMELPLQEALDYVREQFRLGWLSQESFKKLVGILKVTLE
jgi:hypothetical protein